MPYILLIIYSFTTDYIALPCKTEKEAIEKLDEYLNTEIETVKKESGYEPIKIRHDETETELVYESDKAFIDEDSDKAIYKVIEIEHGCQTR